MYGKRSISELNLNDGRIDIKSKLQMKSLSRNHENAGALNTDFFIKAFNDVTIIQHVSPKILADKIANIKIGLGASDEMWERRQASLKELRSLIASGASEYPEFDQLLRTIQPLLAQCVQDLRSTIVREASITVSFLAQRLGKRFENAAIVLLPCLMPLIPNSVNIISTSSITTIKFIFANVQSQRLLAILASSMTHKSNLVRRNCCELMTEIIQLWGNSILERCLDILANCISKGVVDADLESREHSRKAFWLLDNKFKLTAKKIFLNFDEKTKKNLQAAKITSCSDSDTLIVGKLSQVPIIQPLSIEQKNSALPPILISSKLPGKVLKTIQLNEEPSTKYSGMPCNHRHSSIDQRISVSYSSKKSYLHHSVTSSIKSSSESSSPVFTNIFEESPIQKLDNIVSTDITNDWRSFNQNFLDKKHSISLDSLPCSNHTDSFNSSKFSSSIFAQTEDLSSNIKESNILYENSNKTNMCDSILDETDNYPFEKFYMIISKLNNTNRIDYLLTLDRLVDFIQSNSSHIWIDHSDFLLKHMLTILTPVLKPDFAALNLAYESLRVMLKHEPNCFIEQKELLVKFIFNIYSSPYQGFRKIAFLISNLIAHIMNLENWIDSLLPYIQTNEDCVLKWGGLKVLFIVLVAQKDLDLFEDSLLKLKLVPILFVLLNNDDINIRKEAYYVLALILRKTKRSIDFYENKLEPKQRKLLAIYLKKANHCDSPVIPPSFI